MERGMWSRGWSIDMPQSATPTTPNEIKSCEDTLKTKHIWSSPHSYCDAKENPLFPVKPRNRYVAAASPRKSTQHKCKNQNEHLMGDVQQISKNERFSNVRHCSFLHSDRASREQPATPHTCRHQNAHFCAKLTRIWILRHILKRQA